MMTQDKHLLTIAQAADELQIPATTLRLWAREGKIKKYRDDLRRTVLVDLIEIERKLIAKPQENVEDADSEDRRPN